MQQGNVRKTVEGLRRALFVLWVVFVSTLVIYLLIPNFVSISDRATEQLSSASQFIRKSFWVICTMSIAFLYWWTTKYLTRESLYPLVDTPSKITMRTIIAFGIAEYIAVNGFLLALFLGHTWDQYLLTLISGIFFYSLYPSKPFFEDLVRKSVVDGV